MRYARRVFVQKLPVLLITAAVLAAAALCGRAGEETHRTARAARLRGKRLRGQKGFDNAPYSAVNYC